jgi:hypothetical protein
MILLNGQKVTANYFAKYKVAQSGECAEYWGDRIEHDSDLQKITPREGRLIDEAIAKHIDRVRRFLGVDDE